MGFFSKLFNSLDNSNANGTRNAPRRAEPPLQSIIPREENQFSYPGPYYEYFRRLFRGEFPTYSVEEKAIPNKHFKYPADPSRHFSLPSVNRERYDTVFTFHKDNRIALVIEIVHEKFANDKLRKGYQSIGVPYLRFYYDHKGWWNTRSYVVNRVREALSHAQSAGVAYNAQQRRTPVPSAPAKPTGLDNLAAIANNVRQTAVKTPVVTPPAASRVNAQPAPNNNVSRFAPPAAGSRVGSAPTYNNHMTPVGRNACENELPWSAEMPKEENQYNFPGKYYEYFRYIFKSDFPMYRIEEEGRFKTVRRPAGNMRVGRFSPPATAIQGEQIATVYTFWNGPRKALVVEVISENSETQRLRDMCRAERVPYLRFYHNHDRWWNTRSYVVNRVRNALR